MSPGLGDLVEDGGGLPWLGCGEGGEFGCGDGVNGCRFGDTTPGSGVIGVTAARAARPRAEGQDAQPRSWRVTW
jgi:hypothetical protein